MDRLIGKIVNNRYRMQGIVGIGGMAVVYRATDMKTGETVAVKVLKQELLGDAQFRVRFENESRAISILDHQNIVRVYDVALNEDLYYIVMEFLDGITLKQYIRQQGRLGWRETLYFLGQILEALQHAHSRGIIHRDIKPQNIMLLADGSIKVTDFGIARFATTQTNTMTDKAIGSVHYISPEQVSASRVDQRSDIYSLGIMLYEMLTGELPFDAENPVSVALMQLQVEPPHPTHLNPDIPEGLEEILLKCMAKNPDNRYASTQELMYDVALFKENPSIKFEYKYLSDESSTKYMDAIRIIKDEEELEDEGARKGYLGTLAGIVVGVVVISFALIFLLTRGSDTPAKIDVEVPPLLGRRYEEVLQDAEITQHFTVIKAQEEYQNDYAKGEIYRQTPVAGMVVKSGADLRVGVSLGNRTFTMPNLVNWEYRRAETELKRSGVTAPIVVREFSNIIAEDYVTRTEPEFGQEVTADTEVKIYVSQGREVVKAKVPAIVGLPEQEASALIRAAGLVPAGRVVDSDRPEGEVLSQDEEAERELEAGSSVGFTVSSGRQAQNSKEITVQFPLSPPTITLTIKQDGEVTHTGSYETARRSVRINLEGTGTQIVEVYINGVLQESGYVNFDS
ncbi:MAG: Stk1 family PASTA domain-containing Ser/Thr kinase [Clostridiales bacterium]|nr:Stk1 family PASTA domain-containing Ser/Thr kinase [Clostridiales bacterium]